MPSFQIDKRGLTLIEIVIAMGVLGILAVGSIQIFEITRRNQKSIYQSDEFQSAFYEIRTLMTDGRGCTLNLEGKDYSEKDPQPISIHFPDHETKMGRLLLEKGSKRNDLEFTTVELRPVGRLAPTHQLAHLVIGANKTQQNAIGSKYYEKQFLLHIFLADDQKTIDRCWGETSAQSTCVEIGGTYNPLAEQKCDITPKICKAMGMAVAENGLCAMDQTQMNQVMKMFNQMMKGLNKR